MDLNSCDRCGTHFPVEDLRWSETFTNHDLETGNSARCKFAVEAFVETFRYSSAPKL